MTPSPVSRLLHRRTGTLAKGEPAVAPPVLSSAFHHPGDPDGSHFYARAGNPTVEGVEADLALLEGAPSVLFPSGMAAIAAVMHATLRPGDRVLCHADGYYNARALLGEHFARVGVETRHCPTDEMAEADLDDTALVLAETPSNPGLDVCDLARLAERAKAAGALLVVDNTTATALCQRPLELGADAVVTADTKAMAGHSDVLLGHVATNDASLLDAVRRHRTLGGAIPSPFDAWLLHRGLETVELRTARQNANALAVATALRGRSADGVPGPTVTGLRYPGLDDDPSHRIAARQMSGFGPIVSFELADRATAEAFIDACPLLVSATSFGGTHSSAECRTRWGDAVAPGFVRLACGIEPTADLVGAVLGALDGLGGA